MRIAPLSAAVGGAVLAIELTRHTAGLALRLAPVKGRPLQDDVVDLSRLQAAELPMFHLVGRGASLPVARAASLALPHGALSRSFCFLASTPRVVGPSGRAPPVQEEIGRLFAVGLHDRVFRGARMARRMVPNSLAKCSFSALAWRHQEGYRGGADRLVALARVDRRHVVDRKDLDALQQGSRHGAGDALVGIALHEDLDVDAAAWHTSPLLVPMSLTLTAMTR